MDHDILLSCMKRLMWRELCLTVCYVCKSWLSALLDSIVPRECVGSTLPSLESFILPKLPLGAIESISNLMPYWPNLKHAHCWPGMLKNFGNYCQNIVALSLDGAIGDTVASIIAGNFPQLKNKKLTWRFLTNKKNLHKHVEEWNEDEINKKAESIKKHLQCARKYCSICSYLYQEVSDGWISAS
ncbi:hypothetical protein P3X46_010357 [Hevea brasiliensis]|uniref:F-box domain-containing protein n=1 Tax=Hevea brasiliensis TaxID=3981 RepID=A0ABQ9MHZ0_HEVBR|nr:hypothetical protein P3X46_010357 [Hevea brasiliensis]